MSVDSGILDPLYSNRPLVKNKESNPWNYLIVISQQCRRMKDFSEKGYSSLILDLIKRCENYDLRASDIK